MQKALLSIRFLLGNARRSDPLSDASRKPSTLELSPNGRRRLQIMIHTSLESPEDDDYNSITMTLIRTDSAAQEVHKEGGFSSISSRG